ncbi:MAG: AmmeMemoRadiSam system protein A [Anaerovoracaceae bacterium]|jgi:AmmeMemoRadiSam system protein A
MSIIAGYMVPHPPMIIPEIGRSEEELIMPTINGYRKAAADLALLEPETIVISSPHTVMYADYNHISPGKGASGDFRAFGARKVRFSVQYDTELVEAISKEAAKAGLRAGTLGERDPALDHGTMIPLYFIEQAYQGVQKAPNYRVVRIGLSGQPLLDHYALGMAVRNAAEKLGRRVAFVASGDLSHYLKENGPYGFREQGPEYDRRIMETMRRAAFGELLEYNTGFLDQAGECGHRSFTIMAGCFDGVRVDPAKYSYQDVTGVGYGICSYHPVGEDPSREFGRQFAEKEKQRLAAQRGSEDAYVRLARASVESFVKNHKKMAVPEDLPPEMTEQAAGAFVSIHKAGNLRGCIGTIEPQQPNVAEEIVSNAVSAAVRDPRFDPITPAELSQLEITVDILGKPEPVSSEAELDVKKYGVIVSRGNRRGLLLPDLDGVTDVSEQIAIARRKAGIGPKEDVTLERFEVIRHY